MFTTLPERPHFPSLEEEILAFWQENGIKEKSFEKNRDAEPYVIYDGPPTANARPPLHTMVPMSFKDLVGRYQSMRGRYVPRQAGWDTHGLPVEVQMEKKMGLAGKKEILNLVPGDESASIRQFNEACRDSVWEFKQEWDKFVPRVGYWLDTEKPYVTYDAEYIERSWGVFKQIWDKDVVYKGYKVVPYCPRCGTGLSSHEVAQEYQDVKDVSVFVSFPLADNPNRSLLAWTTTPWTLPGNVALAVGAEMEYVVVLQGEHEYVLAKSRLEILKGDYAIVESLTGNDLVGLHYQPLYASVTADATEDRHYVLAADFVTDGDGTGIVHTAVMYGEDDFNLGREAGLPMIHSVGPDGVFLPNVSEFAGLYIRDALVPILKDLQEKGRLYAKQTITHSYPFCWRCKTALVYYATDSWYIAMSRLRSDLVRNNDAVEWHPAHIKQGRFGDFIKEARDWAVSRERFWGTPMPVWTSEDGEYLCVGSFAELKALAQNPDLVGENFDPHRPFVDDIVLVKDGKEFRREPVVLDVWFDSGAMPYASGRDEAGQFPADFIAEATDQTRGWFYTLMAIGTIIRDQSAYKRVVCMGLLLDEQGKKMSKSVGNILDPWETFGTVGADAIRWWIYTVNAAGDTKSFGVKDAQTSFRKTLLLAWNMAKYFLTNAELAGYDRSADPDPAKEDLTALDRWIMHRESELVASVTAYLDAYDFLRAGRSIEQYIDDLSTWYLRRSRKRDDRAFFAVMQHNLLTLVTVMAPMTPFLTEYLYQHLKPTDASQSVHLQDWPADLGLRDQELVDGMASIRKAVELGLSLRAAAGIKVRQPLAVAQIRFDKPLPAADAEALLAILADELNVERATEAVEFEPGFATKAEEGVAIALDTELTDALKEAGVARDFLRLLQNLRKQEDLQPGEYRRLIVDPSGRDLVEPLLRNYPAIVQESFLTVDFESMWDSAADTELAVDGRTVQVAFRADVE